MKKRPRPVPSEGPLRVSDLAQLLDCSTQQVRVLFHRGELPGGFQIRKLIRFDAPTVRRWLEQRKSAGGRATA